MTKTSVVISYCSLDRRFISILLKQVLLFSDDIIIVYYDKLLNGDPEPIEEVDSFVAIDRSKIKPLQLQFTADNSSRYFHNLARWEATKLAKYDHIIYLDADEIPDGSIFNTILSNDLLSKYDGVDFKCHWYFRSAKYQAVQTEQCGLFVNRKIINEHNMFTEHERWSFRYLRNINYSPLLSSNVGPMLHHYSWVRTKEEMLTKVSAWGHKNDKNWAKLIEEEFSRDFNGKDFVHEYSYNIVEDKFNIGL